MKNILALETSSPLLSVAVKKGSSEILQSKIMGFLTHAENLLPTIDRLLKKSKIHIDEIDTFLIGCGPGSFTGLRIGFATLKGFLTIKKKDCFGVLSLDTIAEGTRPVEGSQLAVCLDARRQKIYCRFYRCRHNKWIPQGKAQVVSLTDVLKVLESKTLITGDILPRYRENLHPYLDGRKVRFLPEHYWYPKAEVMVRSFLEARPGTGKENPRHLLFRKLEKPKDFVPLYFRLSEAEEKRKDHANAC